MSFSLITAAGILLIQSDGNEIVKINFVNEENNSIANDVEKKCAKQLLSYFSGDLKIFSVPIHPTGTDFQKKVWEKVSEIPYGKTISYKDLAISLGSDRFVRAVAQANAQNPIPIIIPCHRVIGSNGSLTGYSGGIEKKRLLLTREGTIRQTSLF